MNIYMIQPIASFAMLIVMMSLEYIIPFVKEDKKIKIKRDLHNILTIILSNGLLKLFMPIFPITVALYSVENSVGIFNYLSLPFPLQLVLYIVVMEFTIYVQHRLFHVVPILWRFHKVHHSDSGYDTTLALRFHIVELLISLFIKMTVVIALGVNPIAVLVFETLITVMSLFNHANITIPSKVDTFIQYFFVTPNMHRVHHSVIKKETNSNYSFNLSVCDRVAKSYIKKDEDGCKSISIGLNEYNNKEFMNVFELLILPFVEPKKERN